MYARRILGFSIIELVISVALLGILTMLALPSYSRWISNTQVRTMAESIQNGIRLAQREAATSNGTVSLILTTDAPPLCTSSASASGTNWVICAGSKLLHQNVGKAGSAAAVVSSAFSSIAFDGLGRSSLGAPAEIEVKSTSGDCETDSIEGIRCLNILVSPGGKVRMCDPRLPAGDPSACS